MSEIEPKEPLFNGEFKLDNQENPTLAYTLKQKATHIHGLFSASTSQANISYDIFYRVRNNPGVGTDFVKLDWSAFPVDVDPNDDSIYVAILQGYGLSTVEEAGTQKPLTPVLGQTYYIVAATSSKPNPEALEGLVHWQTATLQFHFDGGADASLIGAGLYYTSENPGAPRFRDASDPVPVQQVKDKNGVHIIVKDGMTDTPPISEAKEDGTPNNDGFLGAYIFCKSV